MFFLWLTPPACKEGQEGDWERLKSSSKVQTIFFAVWNNHFALTLIICFVSCTKFTFCFNAVTRLIYDAISVIIEREHRCCLIIFLDSAFNVSLLLLSGDDLWDFIFVLSWKLPSCFQFGLLAPREISKKEKEKDHAWWLDWIC